MSSDAAAALKFDSIAKAPQALPGVAGNLSTTPAYSRVRFVVNLGPTLSMFEHSLATEGMKDLKAFGYRRGGNAAAGGFGANTTASTRHTNMTRDGEPPNGGAAWVRGFTVKPLALKEPGTVTSADAAANDSNNTSVPYAAANYGPGNTIDLQKMILDQIADLYVAYVQLAGGAKEYFPIEWVKKDGCWVFEVIHPEGWKWGRGSDFVVGFERIGARTLGAKAAAATFYSAVDAALDSTTADGTAALVLQDMIVTTIGPRIDPAIMG